ncbi:hypothetical protein X907_2890 [Glycocaulis alkaliphilus]|uniref:Uncharacterized protein n=1 Tax=Glycocaulis alkaliphilus TaxID=1434191 RepID=A0A3T0EDL5_9PROT|nr:hypothetical protein [Glycocaulis alkaliphilus]AZU05396.1 hypothetical protein X907_2890 [Glycocaulis alkaliphilus]
MARKHPVPPKPVTPSQERPHNSAREEALDEALEESFPASDPPAPVAPRKSR